MPSLLVDYTYYSSKFNKLSQAEFNAINPRAETFTRNQCRKDVYDSVYSNSSDFRQPHLKDAICAMCDFLTSAQDNPYAQGITAISNNGYSETYNQAYNPQEQARSILFQWLTGTGIMGVM